MKKINLKRVTETLNDKELKNVLGGSGNLGEDSAEYSCCYIFANDIQVCASVRDAEAVRSINSNAIINCCLPNPCCG
jgi:natural product precursor